MNVKDAVKMATEYVADIFAAENPENIGLEEVFLNEHENMWEVTIGFSRPWDHQKLGLLSSMQSLNPTRRYKIVKIDNNTEEVKSITIRETPNA